MTSSSSRRRSTKSSRRSGSSSKSWRRRRCPRCSFPRRSKSRRAPPPIGTRRIEGGEAYGPPGGLRRASQREDARAAVGFSPHEAKHRMQIVDEAERHKQKMQKRKEAQDREVAAKTVEKGLLIVNTGKGKGKSTAAFGLILRALGHGWRVGVVQFIKGAWSTGERAVLETRFADLVSWHTMGEGFTWETQDRARDVAAAEA